MTKSTKLTAKRKQPRILVLEALAGSTRAITRAGGNALTVQPTNAKAIAKALSDFRPQGILLTGGSDVNPELYGQKQHKEVYGVNHKRDFNEMCVLAAAEVMQVPVMGICRGSQIMNVQAGGTLVQDIGRHHWGIKHPIRSEPSSLLREIVGRRTDLVHSYHHQMVDQPGKNFEAVAWAPDKKTVEAIESSDGRCLGVQFHPEMASGSQHAKDLFGWLVNVARFIDPSTVPAEIIESLTPVSAAKAITVHSSDLVPEDDWPMMTCYRCGIQFDDIVDRIDHEAIIHNGVAA